MLKKLSPVKQSLLILAVIFVVATAVEIWVKINDDSLKNKDSNFLAQPRPLDSFTLIGEDLKPFGLEQFKDHLNIIFFGYTYCPDVCPTSLGDLALAFSVLEESPTKLGNLQGIFISVDGERDKPETLAEYTDYFHPNIIGATGAKEEVDKIVNKLGAGYRFDPPPEDDPESYHITHSSALFVVNSKAQLVDVIVKYDDANILASRLQKLQKIHSK
ncbi:MAG: SCO family protein [Magnetococcales bacterium]|nr:SCO family protein [Magnetococcales bacterium]